MANSTWSGPLRSGTIKHTTGTTLGDDVANVGNAVLSQTGTIAYTDDGTAVTIAVLPKNSQIIEVQVDVTTAFNGSTTDLLDIGKTGAANHFADNLDVSSAGRILGTSDVSQLANYATVGTSDIDVIATYTDTAGDASAGAARITVLYVQN